MIKYRNLIKKCLVLAFALPTLTYLGQSFISAGKLAISQRITTETQLENALREEKEKLGLQKVDVSASFGKSPLGLGHTQRLSENSFSVVIDDFLHLGKNKTNLRHELYHIYDLKNQRTMLPLWSEFKANLYATYNLRI